jgi:hypothetical protein
MVDGQWSMVNGQWSMVNGLLVCFFSSSLLLFCLLFFHLFEQKGGVGQGEFGVLVCGVGDGASTEQSRVGRILHVE